MSSTSTQRYFEKQNKHFRHHTIASEEQDRVQGQYLTMAEN